MGLMFNRQQFDGRMAVVVGLLALVCFCTTPAYTSDNIEQLMKACSKGKVDEARQLIDQGADVNGRDKAGDTPLTTAVRRGKAEIVELLLEKGADPHLKDGLGDPPLYIAVKTWKKVAIAKSLLEKGADPNLAGQMENTPLIEVARWGETNLVTFLLKHGADPNKKGHLGATPLIAACITTSSGRTPTLKALIDGGADVTLKDQFGFTALTVAKRNKNEELVKFLTDHGVKE